MSDPQRFGGYILEERIAMGGMAEIFRAHIDKEGFEKEVCIKRVLPHFLDSEDFVIMFRDEASVAARLQHANVVHVFDFGEVDGALFLAMEFVDGQDLNSLVKSARKNQMPFRVGQAVQIAIEICRGLYHAHSARYKGRPLNVVHRDISPHNILVSRHGEVKVTDFGIAKAAERATHTSTGVLKGKLAYMAPEQLEGIEVDHRLDQFATGIVLWEMLTLEKAYAGESEATILRKVMTCDIPPPRVFRQDIPEELEAVLMKALAADREQRYPDMRAFERALTKFLFSYSDDPAESDVQALFAHLTQEKKRPPTTMLPKTEPPPSSPTPKLSSSEEVSQPSEDLVSLEDARRMLSITREPGTFSDVFAAQETPETARLERESERNAVAEQSSPSTANGTKATRLLGDDGASEVFGGAATFANQKKSALDNAPLQNASFEHDDVLLPQASALAISSQPRGSKAPLFAAVGLVAVAAVAGGVLSNANDDNGPDAEQVAGAPTNAVVSKNEQESPSASSKDEIRDLKDGQENATDLALIARQEDAKTEDAKTEDAKTEEAKTEEAKTEEAKTEEAKTEDAKTEDAKTEEAKTGEKKKEPAAKKRSRRTSRAAKARGKAKAKSEAAAVNKEEAATKNTAKGTGVVLVDVEGTWAEVFERGKKIGATPFQARLSVGKHYLLLQNPETKKKKTVIINVKKSGKHTKFLKNL
ncbi:MAG: serine/threonine protein kinase [Deltaproteobacteria bacterium]|nr:serine/threonine protein kinase [Deltaproteobacteria bacterium]